MPLKTKTDIVRELLLCGRDPLYFIRTYAMAQHPVRGLVPLKTYGYQDDIVNAYQDHRLNIILKARQLGITTVTAAYIAWYTLFRADKNVLIVSTKQDVAKNTIRMIRVILKNLPAEIRVIPIKVDNRQSIELENGSRVKAETKSADVGRSEAVSLLFIDEVAHIEKMEEIWTSVWPTISAGGKAILASTPKGTSNFFYRHYKQAQNYENKFNCRFGTYVNPENSNEAYNDRLPWWVHPEHNKEWFANETAGKTAKDIAQEYLCEFNTSGDTFLPGETLKELEFEVKEPIERTYDDRNLWIWKYPEPHGVYLIPCDVASGFAEDFSAFHVLRIDENIEQVAEYKGKIPPDVLGVLLMKVSELYHNARIAPENNSGWSGQTIQRITDANYPYLHWSSRRNKNELIDVYSAPENPNAQVGYSVTNSNRIAMLSKMEQYIRKKDIKLHSSRLVDEFRDFVWNNGRPQAARLAHDDLVMALAGGIWIREESYATSYRSSDVSLALLAGITTLNKNVSDFNGFNGSTNSILNNKPKESTVTLDDGRTVPVSHWLLLG
jgi:hypothetical protein